MLGRALTQLDQLVMDIVIPIGLAAVIPCMPDQFSLALIFKRTQVSLGSGKNVGIMLLQVAPLKAFHREQQLSP